MTLRNTDATAAEPPSDSLAAALARHGYILSAEQIETLDRFCRALWNWNEKLNLTRHTSYEKFVSRDMLDASHLDPLLESGERVLDVGTGGGLPGVPLAILRPDILVELCDSVAKKARAVEAIVKEAGIPLPVHAAAAQTLVTSGRYDTLIVRAVAPLAKLLTWFNPHWGDFRRLLIVKGPAWVEERKTARERGLMREVSLRKRDAYPLPGTESESVILEVRAKDEGAEEE